ncbi:MAG TPA: ATP-binding cassette domain-containing protein [Jatrophihabitans sp.]|jgi:oleandomycin transport system ATP-binding protein
MTDLAFEAEGLTKNFDSNRALDGVNLAATRGTVLGVLGPNGAGKTTAVRILATLLRPDSGRAMVNGYDVLKQPQKVRASIGLTGQFASVDDDLTGTQNLVMIGQLLDLSPRDARTRAAELLEWFDLTDAASRVAKNYSGGMRRRLDLASSLVGRPSVIFLDEPTTGLDPAKREDMWDVVRNLVADGSTVLLTTQYLEEADALADEISVFHHGRVIAHDTPHGLKRVVGGQRLTIRPSDSSRQDEVARILHELSDRKPEPEGRGALTVPVDGDAVLPAAIAKLASAGIGVDELSLHLPSLDEVFFTLTGTRTNDSDEENAA